LKERLVTLGLALAALVLFYILFLPKPAAPDAAPELPLSTELRPNGYQAAWRWLKSQQIPVTALHERYDRLLKDGVSPGGNRLFAGSLSANRTGNVLLTTLPHRLPAGGREASMLDLWVERGNTLIVMVALDDTPAWSLRNNSRLVDEAARLTRLKFSVVDPDGPAPKTKPQRIGPLLESLVAPHNSSIEPTGEHPLTQGVTSIAVTSQFLASRWRATPMDQAAVLQLGKTKGTGDAAMWLRAQGNGRVITFAVSGIFSNRAIGEQDNARLLSNLIAWSRQPDGAVIFDDAHQGVVTYYDSKAFFADPRLHSSLGWIVFLWFVFVLGVQRLRSRVAVANPADITAFVSSSGEFFAATLTPAAAAARLLGNFFNTIRARLGLSQDGTPEWQWLAAQARVSARDLAELRRLHELTQAGRGIDLMRLQNLLVQLQGKVI
jgi:Domain of unknown function (DUF4350)